MNNREPDTPQTNSAVAELKSFSLLMALDLLGDDRDA